MSQITRGYISYGSSLTISHCCFHGSEENSRWRMSRTAHWPWPWKDDGNLEVQVHNNIYCYSQTYNDGVFRKKKNTYLDYRLVVEPYPSEKYEFVNGKDDILYMKWKIIQMFETTNQIIIYMKKYIIWVNYKNSLTWILRPFGDHFPY